MNGKELDLSISEDQSNADPSAGCIETVEVEALGAGSLPSAQESTLNTDNVLSMSSTPKRNGNGRERRLSPAREELKRRLLPIGSNAVEDQVQTSPIALQGDANAAELLHDEKQKDAAIKIQSAQRQRQAKAEVDEIRAKKTAATQKIQNLSRGRAARKRVQKIREEKQEALVAQKEEPLKAQDIDEQAVIGLYSDDFDDVPAEKVNSKENNSILIEENSLASEITYADDFEESSADYDGAHGTAKNINEMSASSGDYASKIGDSQRSLDEPDDIFKTKILSDNIKPGADSPEEVDHKPRMAKKAQKPQRQAAALDISAYRSPYQINLSKQSRKAAKQAKNGSMVRSSIQGSMGNLDPIGNRTRGSGSFRKIKSRDRSRDKITSSVSASKLDDKMHSFVNNQYTRNIHDSAPLIAIHPMDYESRVYMHAKQSNANDEGQGKQIVSPLYERIVEMRDSISSIKERFRALKQISELDNEIALEGGWTERDIKEELVKLKHELARERERLKVTLQNGAHRLGRKSGGIKGAPGAFAPNLSTSSTTSSRARERLFSDDVAIKLKKLCRNLDKHCRAREREIAAEKRGWVKPLSNKLSPVTRHLKPTFDRNPIAPLFRGSATDPTGGREIGFVHDPRPLSELQARYQNLQKKIANIPGEKIDDDDLQEMWSLEVEIAEAKRMPRYKAQSKSLKRRKQRQYAPVRRRSGR